MVDFNKLLSPELRAKIASETAEIQRMWGLPDRFLAADLLRKARAARDLYPEHFARGEYDTYSTSLVWDVVPEVAYRMGATDVRRDERRADVRACDVDELREWLGNCLNWAPLIREAHDAAGADPWLMLARSPQQGNPVLFALDRICAPDMDSKDRGARLVREISRVRGFEETSAWHPGLDKRFVTDREVDISEASGYSLGR